MEIRENLREAVTGWLEAGQSMDAFAESDQILELAFSRQVSGSQLAKLVAQRGWQLSRINGSHHIFTMPGRRERLVIPVHGNQPPKIGLLRSLMKISGLEGNDL